LPEFFSAFCFLFLLSWAVQLWSWLPGFHLPALTYAVKGGCERFVAIERKSYDPSVVGRKEDIVKISKNERGRRFSIFLPEPVALWLMRAWGRFRNSKSSCWCNQMKLHSRFFMLEFRCNLAGKFLKLSVTKEGYRTFVIFPTGRNEKGWDRIFKAIEDIVGQSSLEPDVYRKGNSYQSLKAKSGYVGALPPPPPSGCCPQRGFRGEPACFL